MKPSSKNSAPHGGARYPQTGIDAGNWEVKALAFMGGADGFVIRAVEGDRGEIFTKQPATDAQWIAWVNWFDFKKIPCSFVRSFGCATVPCEWPEGFDADAITSDRYARLPRHPLVTQQAGRRLPDWLRPKDLDQAGKVSRPRMASADAQTKLETLAEKYRAEPLAPSADLAEQFAREEREGHR